MAAFVLRVFAGLPPRRCRRRPVEPLSQTFRTEPPTVFPSISGTRLRLAGTSP